jgi:hypothetical protein
VQVPKQGRNLHRESAFYVALAVQVHHLKWNLLQFCTASYTAFFDGTKKMFNFLIRKYYDASMAFSGLIHLGECVELQNHFVF